MKTHTSIAVSLPTSYDDPDTGETSIDHGGKRTLHAWVDAVYGPPQMHGYHTYVCLSDIEKDLDHMTPEELVDMWDQWCVNDAQDYIEAGVSREDAADLAFTVYAHRIAYLKAIQAGTTDLFSSDASDLILSLVANHSISSDKVHKTLEESWHYEPCEPCEGVPFDLYENHYCRWGSIPAPSEDEEDPCKNGFECCGNAVDLAVSRIDAEYDDPKLLEPEGELKEFNVARLWMNKDTPTGYLVRLNCWDGAVFQFSTPYA